MAEYQKVCGWCGAGFVARRFTAKFCSVNCKMNAWRNAWRAANPENPEKQREYDRARYAKNPEKAREKMRVWRRSKGQTDAAFHIMSVMQQLKPEGET